MPTYNLGFDTLYSELGKQNQPPAYLTVSLSVRTDDQFWNTIFSNLLQTFDKLLTLGFTYYNGKVAIIKSDVEGEKY